MTAASRRHLADFLTSRRRLVDPPGFDPPPAGGRRTRGLRREEVALLAGVSHTWCTWLEQGRDIRPSRRVVDALACTLRLTAAEHEYMKDLAAPHHSQARGGALQQGRGMPPHLQRLLDALSPSPAFVTTPSWAIVGWNRAYERFYPGVAAVPAQDRNLLWLLFTDPSVRRLLGDWATDSRRFLAQFRAEAGTRLTDPDVVEVVDRLEAASAEFRAGWAGHDVDGFRSAERRFEHPEVGTLLLEHHQLTPADAPGLHLVVHTAVRDTGTADELARLCAAPQ